MLGWSFGARAQKSAVPLIGWLNGGSRHNYADIEAAFREGLTQIGFVEGQNLAIVFRYADGQYNRLPRLASDLVTHNVAAIFASSSGAALAAKAATQRIPIVFAGASDPVEIGLVPNLNRPGGNITGATMFSHVLGSKKLEVLHQLVPGGAATAILVNRGNPSAEAELQNLQAAAREAGWRIAIFDARNDGDIESSFTQMVEHKAGTLLVVGDPLFTSQRDQIVALAARYSIPSTYPLRTFAKVGGLVYYGTSFGSAARNCGIYVGRILRGEKPGELPVLLPSNFELVINLKTAKALGLAIPQTMLATADEVIE